MGMRELLGVWFIMHETSEGKDLAFEMEAYESLRFGQFRVAPGWGKEE